MITAKLDIKLVKVFWDYLGLTEQNKCKVSSTV